MSTFRDRRLATRVVGPRRLTKSGADKLAGRERQGLFLDLTDRSVRIKDDTTAANRQNKPRPSGFTREDPITSLLTYTAPSVKMTRGPGPNGLLRYGAHNQWIYSEEFDNAAWNKTLGITVSANATAAPDGTLTGDKLIAASGVSNARIYNNTPVALVAGPYACSVCLKEVPGEFDEAAIGFYNGSQYRIAQVVLATGAVVVNHSEITVDVESLGNGWFRYTINYTQPSATANGYISVQCWDSTFPDYTSASTTFSNSSGNASDGIYAWGAHLRRTPSDSTYLATGASSRVALPYSFSADGNCEGILVEEQRTNLVSHSEAFDDAAWTKSTTTITANDATAPDGTTTADRLASSSLGGVVHQAYQIGKTIVSGALYTASCFLKAGTATFGIINIYDTVKGDNRVYFNLSNGTIGTVDADCTASIEDYGNGWYRCIVTYTSGSTSGGMSVEYSNADNVSSPDLSSSEYIHAWGSQYEAGAFPTSYIPTAGSTVTRAADDASQLTSTYPHSATAGTLYFEGVPYAASDLAGCVSVNDGSGNEEVLIYKDASANILAQVEDGGANQLAPLDSGVNATDATVFKAALAWAANDFAYCANGSTVQTDTSGTLPTVTKLEYGTDQANNYFSGTIKKIIYIPRRLSNSELQTLTS